jgi:hypothetical protein
MNGRHAYREPMVQWKQCAFGLRQLSCAFGSAARVGPIGRQHLRGRDACGFFPHNFPI